MQKKILTIRETVRRAQSEGIPITEYTLRRWIREGEIPVRYAGNRALIHYPTLMHYLCPTYNTKEDEQNE